jgi:hypothetical protein
VSGKETTYKWEKLWGVTLHISLWPTPCSKGIFPPTPTQSIWRLGACNDIFPVGKEAAIIHPVAAFIPVVPLSGLDWTASRPSIYLEIEFTVHNVPSIIILKFFSGMKWGAWFPRWSIYSYFSETELIGLAVTALETIPISAPSVSFRYSQLLCILQTAVCSSRSLSTSTSPKLYVHFFVFALRARKRAPNNIRSYPKSWRRGSKMQSSGWPKNRNLSRLLVRLKFSWISSLPRLIRNMLFRLVGRVLLEMNDIYME